MRNDLLGHQLALHFGSRLVLGLLEDHFTALAVLQDKLGIDDKQREVPRFQAAADPELAGLDQFSIQRETVAADVIGKPGPLQVEEADVVRRGRGKADDVLARRSYGGRRPLYLDDPALLGVWLEN